MTQNDDVEATIFYGETHVFCGIGATFAFVEVAGGDGVWRAFPIDAEGPCAEDGFAIAGHPGREIGENLSFVGVDGSVSLERDVEAEIAVLADDVCEQFDDDFGGFVLVLIEGVDVVVPVADAGVGLPGQGEDVVGTASFEIQGCRAAMLRYELLAEDDGFELTAPLDALVVKVRGYVEPRLSQRQLGVVEVEHVGIVLIDQVFAAEKPGIGELRVVAGRVLIPRTIVAIVPILHCLDGGKSIGHDKAGAYVKFLGVQAVPAGPLAGSAFGEAVIADALQRAFGIVSEGGLKPVPCMTGVIADAETKAAPLAEGGPGADDIFFRADPVGVPCMVPGVVVIEVVVVIGEGHEVFGTRRLVQVQQRVGIPALCLPQDVDVFESDFRGMTVGLDVIVVGGVALDVHAAGIPVALLRHALRGPVGPDAELGVAEPVRRPVLRLQGLPTRLKRPGRQTAFRAGRKTPAGIGWCFRDEAHQLA